MAEKTNGEEIYGGAEGALERAEKSIENRRAFIKKAMEPAEKAKKELIKATATDEVRKQGLKDNRIPRIRPYVERIDVSDRKALSKLIESAKKDKRVWRVGKSLKEGYRYTFYTKRFLEDVEEPMFDAAPAEDVGAPADAAAEASEEKPTAWDVLNGLLNLAITDKGELSVCIKGDESENPSCLLTRTLSEDEIAILGIAGDEASSAESEKRPSVEMPDQKGEPLDEASSAEKRAYRNGGEDAEDVIYGKAIGRVDDKLARDTLAGMYKDGGEDREAAKAVLRKSADKAAADFEDKEAKMQAKGYTPDPDADELFEPGISTDRKCPKCGKADLNDAGECPLCDLGDETVLDDSLKLHEDASESDTSVKDDVEIRLDDLRNFKPFAGAKDTYNIIVGEGKLPKLAEILADFANDGKMTSTDLNDILWFERDWVLSRLDIDLARIKSGIKSGDDVIDAEE